jgi:two-component system, LuxR family, sensor kinase FixL
VVRASVDAIVVIDHDGAVEVFNPAAERIFGYQPEQVLGEPVTMLAPVPYRSALDAFLRSHLVGEAAPATGAAREAQGLRSDGTKFPILVSVGFVGSGDRPELVAVIRDLTESRAVQAELKERDRGIEATFENAPLPTLSIAADGRVLRANQAAGEAFGCTAEELSGEQILDLVAAEHRAGLAEMLRSVAAGEPLGLGGPEWHYQRRGGDLVVGRSHASAVRSASGESLMMVLQFEDRTERRRIGQELARVRDDLAHVGRLGTVGELATGIAHEINQPLTAISSYAQACRFLIERGDASSEKLAETLQKITDSARRAGAVIEHLRGFLRKRETERSLLETGELVRGVAQLVSVDPRFQNIDLELDLGAASVPVIVDRVQLQQVLLNLLLNALDAMERDQGGRITVTVSQPDDQQVWISVRDQGIGIPADIGERVFESFFSTKPAGMGFGLALSRSIVEAQGGRLWFTNNEDRGTTFHLGLPAVASSAGQAEQS